VNTMLGSNQPSNMPNGFVVPASDMVPHMGGHAWDPDQQPADAMSWMEPVWVRKKRFALLIFTVNIFCCNVHDLCTHLGSIAAI